MIAGEKKGARGMPFSEWPAERHCGFLGCTIPATTTGRAGLSKRKSAAEVERR